MLDYILIDLAETSQALRIEMTSVLTSLLEIYVWDYFQITCKPFFLFEFFN